MANIPEFISVLRRIRDVIYPEVKEIHEDTKALKSEAELSKSAAAASAAASASSAVTATTRANEIKNVSAQANTLSSGSLATVSYNPTDGKFTFGLPVGAKGDKGESYTINAKGTTSGRAAYDTQSVGFSYLDISLSTVYFKLSATSGDWSTGTSFGKGEDGADGADGAGIASIVFHSTTSDNGLASQLGGIDTYRITLSNSNTYDISLINGSDLNINGYGDKEIPKDDDEFAISDSDSHLNLKKLSFGNLKSSLNTGFKNHIINGKKVVNQRRLTSTDNSYNQDRWYKAGVNWYQGIEGDNNLISGKKYTISWVGTATASYYVGTATSADINNQSFTRISNGSNFVLNIANGQNLWIKFASDATGSTFNFVQLEEGSVATPFENRPYGLEFSLCQRYYEIVMLSMNGIIHAGNGDYRGRRDSFKVQKRIPPSVTISTAIITGFGLGSSGSATGLTGSIVSIDSDTMGVRISSIGNYVNISGVLGGGDFMYSCNDVGLAYCDSEL